MAKKAIVRYRKPKTIIRYRKPPKQKRSRRRKNPGGGVSKNVVLAGAAFGYLTEQTKLTASLPEVMQPTNAKGTLILGGVLYLLGKNVVKSKYVKDLSTAVLTIGAYKLGQSNFTMQGEDDEYTGEL